MFIGHIAVGLAGKRVAPSVSLATWFASVQLVDMLWPLLLAAGVVSHWVLDVISHRPDMWWVDRTRAQ